MKYLYLLLIAIFAIQTNYAQIVNIPDANFKNALVNTICVDIDFDGLPDISADTNNDGEIQVSEAESISSLNVSGQNISSLIGIQAFKNLYELGVINNQLTTIDITGFQSDYCDLYLSNNNFTTTANIIGFSGGFLDVSDNQLTSIDTINFPTFVESFDCSNNQITNLDLSGLSFIYELYFNNNPVTNFIAPSRLGLISCNNTNLTSLDLSGIEPYLETLWCNNNSQLEFINLKNGLSIYNISDQFIDFSLNNNPNLQYFCTENNIEYVQSVINNFNTNCIVGSYCSFEPGGTFNKIQGTSSYDANNNGCDAIDAIIPNLKINITQGSQTGSFMSDASGNYSFPLSNGTHTITPDLEDSSYFAISPSSITINFPTETSPYIQDFCISPNGIYNDLEITILPLEDARPGFDTDYKLIYKNKGTTTLSGTVDLVFQDDLMNLIASTPTTNYQTANTLNWDYTNLVPFESRELLFTMNINTPMDTPAVNGGDTLIFIVNINSNENDETPTDNTFSLNQIVVNSYDPNDKICLDGDTITPEQIGKEVNYRIRFENTGTANAINIVVRDVLDDTMFNINSLRLVDSSHEVETRVTNNIVEFIFENINLPFDDANNDGYVIFKIKTLNTLVEGDTFENDAEIYFDYNFPIITNNFIASIEAESLTVEEFNRTNLEVYPNPIKDNVTIKGLENINSVTIYDVSGRLIQNVSILNNKEVIINMTKLNTGTYFAKVKTADTDNVIKLIKK